MEGVLSRQRKYTILSVGLGDYTRKSALQIGVLSFNMWELTGQCGSNENVLLVALWET